MEEESSDFKIKVPWGFIAGKTWGKPCDARVLMVHGVMDNVGTFDRLIAHLPQKIFYVCIELPGHGFSSHFPAGVPLNYFDYVLAIKYVLDELSWENVYYVGHSFGAHLGIYFSLIYPNRIKKLVLLDGCCPGPVPEDLITSKIKKDQELAVRYHKNYAPISYTKEKVMNALMNPNNSKYPGRLTPEAAKALFDRSVIKTNDNLYIYSRDARSRNFIFPILTEEQNLYFLSKLKVRTLLILATDGLPYFKKLQPKIIEILKKLNHVNIVTVEGNHDLHNNTPEKISSYLTNFLYDKSSKL